MRRADPHRCNRGALAEQASERFHEWRGASGDTLARAVPARLVDGGNRQIPELLAHGCSARPAFRALL